MGICGELCLYVLQMYITSVLWSDQNDIVVYRSFEEFKKMHVSIKGHVISEGHVVSAIKRLIQIVLRRNK